MVEMLLGQIVERMAVEAAGVEVEAHHQRIVIGRDAMPRRSSTTQSNLRLWPILSTAGSSSSGFSFASTSAAGELVGPLGEHVVAAMLERDVAGLVAFGGEADPDQFGGDAVAPVGLGVERDPARCAMASAIQRSSAASSVTVS